MNEQFKLRFAVAGRTLWAISMPVTHAQAFQVYPLSQIITGDFEQPVVAERGAVFWSAEIDCECGTQVASGGTLFRVLQRFPRFVTEFEGDFEGLLARVSAKKRSTLRRKVRKFAKESGGDIDWREYRDPEQIREFLRLAVPLAEKTYQSRLFDGALPSSEAFAASAQRAAEAGAVRAYLLFLHEQPVAYLYAPQEGESLIYAFLGYDPAMGHLSVGTVLQYLVHEHLFAEGDVKQFDFTAGDGAHKELFSNRRYECCDVLAIPDSLRWRLALASHGLWERTVSVVASKAESWGVKARLRRLIRGS